MRLDKYKIYFAVGLFLLETCFGLFKTVIQLIYLYLLVLINEISECLWRYVLLN